MQFEKLSKAERRVAVAKDALEQIKFGKIVPEFGEYYEVSKFKDNVPVQCHACAKGTAFISYMNKKELCHFKESNGGCADNNVIIKALADTFDSKQLHLMEAAFEGREMYCEPANIDADRAIDFGLRHGSAESRLTAILENVIENDGEFIP